MSRSSGTGSSRSRLSSQSSISLGGWKTKFEKDVEAAQRKGVSDCRNMRHWRTITVPNRHGGEQIWTDVEIKPHRQILQMMAPGKAKCTCERDACKWAWAPGTWNHKGMYQTQWVLTGQESKGIPLADESYAAKKVWPLRHSVPGNKIKKLIARFPEWHFVGSYGPSHDHPFAHYSTKLASERLMDMLPRGSADAPKVYIDLNGNPSANQAYMRRVPGIEIVTLVNAITPKDFVNKAIKWGPQFDENGVQLWYDDMHIRDIPRELEGMGSVISGFISLHTSYYYDAAEIARLLNWAPNAVLYASMHRFEGMHGVMNDGEQVWEKTPSTFSPRIVQTNVKTGESYEHQDNAWWYEFDSRLVGEDGFGWTMNELCEETYVFMATACPASQARMSCKLYHDPKDRVALKTSSSSAQTKKEMRDSRTVVVSVGGLTCSAPIAPAHVELFDQARTAMIARSRTAAQYKDHVSRCKVMAKSIMTDKNIQIESQQLEDIARMSFMIDMDNNLHHDKDYVFGPNILKVVTSDHLYKTGNASITTTTLGVVCDMLMASAGAKDVKMAVVGAARVGAQHAARRNLIHSIN